MTAEKRTLRWRIHRFHSQVGSFTQISDDDAELLSGGVVQPSRTYDGSGSYGQRGQGFGPDNNPSTFYGGLNYGQAKKEDDSFGGARNRGQAKKFN